MWERLVQRLQPIFARIIYRVCSASGTPRPEEVDDLVQECFLKLQSVRQSCLPAATFENEHAALAYFRVLAGNTARDHFRLQNAEKRGASKTVPADDRLAEIAGFSSDPPPDRALLIAQIDNLLNADSQGRTIFWLYFKQGLTAKEIADIRAFNLSTKGVESLIRRLTVALRQKLNSKPEGNFSQEPF